jgi:uncharacterized membrane protein
MADGATPGGGGHEAPDGAAGAGATGPRAYPGRLGRALLGTGGRSGGPGGAAATRKDMSGGLARAGHLEYDRILFFSDAVFAIAITLLVVDLPEQLETGRTAIEAGTVLRDSVGAITGFAISFAAIGLFWLSHHGLFRFVTAFDRRLTLLNLLFLGTIAFLPYPTALISRASSSEAPAVIFYAACVGTSGLMLLITFLYACTARAGLVTGISPRERRYVALSIGRIPVVFAASIGVAMVSPRGAEYFWLTAALLDIIIDRFHRRGERPRPPEADDPSIPAPAAPAP